MDIILLALGAGLGGLITAIYTNFLHAKAERSLVEAIKAQRELARQLESIKADLEISPPDPEDVTRARQIVMIAANALSSRQKKDIAGTLERGSDKSKANYIVKVLDEVSKTPA